MSKLATADDYRNVDWKPWKRPSSLKPGALLPRRSDWDEIGITARMAYAAMLMSREALIKSAIEADDEVMDEILSRLTTSREKLHQIVTMIDCALTRTLAAAHHKVAD
jgi:hypothetical protein